MTNEGTVFTFHSNLDAPRYCLINIDIQKPERQHWTTLIPQHDKDVLGETACTFLSILSVLHRENVIWQRVHTAASAGKWWIRLLLLRQLWLCVVECENSSWLHETEVPQLFPKNLAKWFFAECFDDTHHNNREVQLLWLKAFVRGNSTQKVKLASCLCVCCYRHFNDRNYDWRSVKSINVYVSPCVSMAVVSVGTVWKGFGSCKE